VVPSGWALYSEASLISNHAAALNLHIVEKPTPASCAASTTRAGPSSDTCLLTIRLPCSGATPLRCRCPYCAIAAARAHPAGRSVSILW
jgi:hypothetical protein